MVALLGRLFVPLAFLLYASLYYANVRRLPIEAGLLPELMLALLAALLLWDITDETVKWRRGVQRPWRDDVRIAGELLRARGLRPAGAMILTFLWIFVGMTFLGFYTSTALFILIGLIVLGERRIWLIALLTIAALAFTYVTFTLGLRLRLPTGLFI